MIKFLKSLNAPLPKAFLPYAWVAVLLTDAALRVVRVAVNFRMTRDAYLYVAQAELLAGNGWTKFMKLTADWRPPLLIAAIDLFSSVLPISATTAGVAISLTCGIMLPVVIRKTVLLITGNEELALWNMLIASCFPHYCKMSYDILRDGPYLLFSTMFLYFLAEMIVAGKNRSAVWCGASCMLAVLTRFEALECFFIFVFAASCLLLCRIAARRVFKWVGLFIVGIVLTGLVFCAVTVLPPGKLCEIYLNRFELFRKAF